jgi:hypothetical protein
MGSFKNSDRFLDLDKKLLCVPPRVTTGSTTRIDDESGILYYFSLSIPNDQATTFWIKEIRNVDEATTTLLSENCLPLCSIQPVFLISV